MMTQARKTLELRIEFLVDAISKCHMAVATRKRWKEIEASMDAVEIAWDRVKHTSWEDGNHLLLRQDLPMMVERVFTKAEKYLAKAEKYAEAEMGPERWAMAVKYREAKEVPELSKEDSYEMPCEDEDRGKELNAKVDEVALEVSTVNEVNVDEVNDVDEVNVDVDEVNVDEVNVDTDEVNVDVVNVNEVNKVNEESTMNEDIDEVCDAKEGMSKGKSPEIEAKVNEKSEEVVMAKPPDVPLRFDFTAKVQVEESGMKEEKNLKDDKKVEGKNSCHANWDPGELVDAKAKVEVSVVKEVKQIDDLKMREESRHASWDPGELFNAEAQMFNVKVEVTPSGDVNANAFFDTMSLFNFVRLYTSEVLLLVARNAVRFVDINPLSSTSFAESFLPILSDYG